MAEIPHDPAEAAQLLRRWADDESINHVLMRNPDLIRLADMLDPPAAAHVSPKWDDPAPEPAKPKACEVCGVYPAPIDACGFGACPNAASDD